MALPKHLIFDLDGTLVDSALVISRILNQMRNERGLLPLEREQFTHWISLGAEQLLSRALVLDVDTASDHLADFRDRYMLLPTPAESVYRGVHLALSDLAEQGVQLSICTNKPRRLAEKVLAETGLGKYFPFVCAGGDYASPKPDPINLFACVNYFEIPAADTFLVGDSTVDQDCASNANIGFIFHAKGYDDGVNAISAKVSFEDYRFFNLLLLTI
jgi:phosphoglycolate phosphatase